MTKFTLPVLDFDASCFYWHGGVGSADASTLGLRPGQSPYRRCFADATDVGCRVCNYKKGTHMNFVLEKIDKIEGDVVAWVFNNNDKSNPLKLIISNS